MHTHTNSMQSNATLQLPNQCQKDNMHEFDIFLKNGINTSEKHNYLHRLTEQVGK